MKLQNLTVIFIIIVLPIILLVSLYISTGLKTIKYQALYDTGLITATQDAIQAFEINTLKNKYSANAEVKRSAIKASVKMLEKGLCNTCNISSYNTDEIEEYIPAILFGMNNGFYLYSPSYNPTTDKYEHSLKNYVYYSEQLEGKSEKDYGIVIIYHLDSYVEVSGYFDQNYEFGEGYLINIDEVKFKKSTDSAEDAGETRTVEDFYKEYEKALEEGDSLDAYEITYYGTEIDVADELAVNYFVDNYKFSKWFKDTVIERIDFRNNDYNYLKVSRENDPEDPESAFSMHKKEVIRNKIQNVLNSSITAYSKRTYGQEYKMPKLSEEDWEKIYTDISVITFFQGKKIGFTKYNGYCVLNSNNHYELINPNLLYFSTDDNGDKYINTTNDYYHDIRCSKLNELSSIEIEQELGYELPTISTIRGWKIGRFQRKTITKTDVTGDEEDFYIYERNELGCYECINGSVNSGTSVYDYIAVAEPSSHKGNTTNGFIKESYWTSLARERAKLHEDKEIPSDISVYKEVKLATDDDSKYSTSAIARNGETVTYKITIENNAKKTDTINILDEFDVDKIKDIKITSIKSGETISYNSEKTDLTDESGGKKGIQLNSVSIPQEARLEIIYNAKVFGTVGESIQNTVNIYPSSGGYSLGKAEATVIIRGSKIKVAKSISEPKVEIGTTSKYTINIENGTDYDELVDIVDELPSGVELKKTTITPKKINDVMYSYDSSKRTISWDKVTLSKNQKITITFDVKIVGKIGETLTNYAKVYVPTDKTTTIAEASVTSTNKKTITFANNKKTLKDVNIILVADVSWSEGSKERKAMKNAINKILKDCADLYKGYTVSSDGREIEDSYEDNRLWVIDFGGSAKYLNLYRNAEGYYEIKDFHFFTGGTDYAGGLGLANEVTRDDVDNIILFMTDGAPTLLQQENLTGIWKYMQDLIDDLATIGGGWCEVAMSGRNSYCAKVLVEKPLEWLGFSGWFSMNSSLARAVAWNIIDKSLKPIKSNNRNKIYSIYANTAKDDTPYYGVNYLSSNFDVSGNVVNDNYCTQIYDMGDLYEKLLEIINNHKTESSGEDIELEQGDFDISGYNIDSVKVIIKDDAGNIIATYTKDDTAIVSNSDKKVHLNNLPSEYLDKNITIEVGE